MSEERYVIPPMVVTVKIGKEMVKRDLSEDLRLDEEHINEYLIKQPALVAYWSTLYYKQKNIVERAKVVKQRKYAELQKFYRECATNDGEKVVNAEIEAKIFLDEDYQEIEERLLDEEETLGVLKAAVEAVKGQDSSLIGLGANMRTERTIGFKKPKGESIEDEYERKRRRGKA